MISMEVLGRTIKCGVLQNVNNPIRNTYHDNPKTRSEVVVNYTLWCTSKPSATTTTKPTTVTTPLPFPVPRSRLERSTTSTKAEDVNIKVEAALSGKIEIGYLLEIHIGLTFFFKFQYLKNCPILIS